MKKRKSSAIHPAGCPNGPHQMAIIDPQLFGPVDDCVLLQASGDGMRNAGMGSSCNLLNSETTIWAYAYHGHYAPTFSPDFFLVLFDGIIAIWVIGFGIHSCHDSHLHINEPIRVV